ncbi:MAG: hypothetical protein AAB268_10240 [Elusimicrobiota bacterium]
MKELLTRPGLGHGEGGFGQTEVPNPGASSEISDQVLMEFKNLGKRQKFRRHSGRQVLQRAGEALLDGMKILPDFSAAELPGRPPAGSRHSTNRGCGRTEHAYSPERRRAGKKKRRG